MLDQNLPCKSFRRLPKLRCLWEFILPISLGPMILSIDEIAKLILVLHALINRLSQTDFINVILAAKNISKIRRFYEFLTTRVMEYS